MEQWINIPNYEGIYQVSSLGRVRSLIRWRHPDIVYLKPGSDKRGYLKVNLIK